MNKIYRKSNQNNTVARSSSLKLFQPLRKKASTLKRLSYLGPFIWNGLPDDVKMSNNVNTLKHKIKRGSRHYYGKNINISTCTMGKFPASSPHFNPGIIIRIEI